MTFSCRRPTRPIRICVVIIFLEENDVFTERLKSDDVTVRLLCRLGLIAEPIRSMMKYSDWRSGAQVRFHVREPAREINFLINFF